MIPVTKVFAEARRSLFAASSCFHRNTAMVETTTSTYQKLRQDMHKLQADIEKALAEEETLLRRLESSNGDAWTALRDPPTREPLLYRYLRQHRRRTQKRHPPQQQPNQRATNGSDSDDDDDDDNFLSTRSVNGSNEASAQPKRLTFAEYCALSDKDKKDCIQMGLRGKERVRLEV